MQRHWVLRSKVNFAVLMSSGLTAGNWALSCDILRCDIWCIYWPQEPVLSVVVGHVVTVTVSPGSSSTRGRGRHWLEAGRVCPLCPLLDGLVIDSEEEMGPGWEGTLFVQGCHQGLSTSTCCLLNEAPSTVEALPHFWQLPRRLQQLVVFLLQLGAQLCHGLLKIHIFNFFIFFSLFLLTFSWSMAIFCLFIWSMSAWYFSLDMNTPVWSRAEVRSAVRVEISSWYSWIRGNRLDLRSTVCSMLL